MSLGCHEREGIGGCPRCPTGADGAKSIEQKISQNFIEATSVTRTGLKEQVYSGTGSKGYCKLEVVSSPASLNGPNGHLGGGIEGDKRSDLCRWRQSQSSSCY